MDFAGATQVTRGYVRRSLTGGLAPLAFPQQRAFMSDDAKMRAALCTRRAGKSMGAGLHLFDGALEKPGTSQLYVGLTRESCKRIMHKDVLKVIDRRIGIGALFNETTLTVSLPNGSVIYLLGVDAKPDEQEKILGQKFYRAVVDECASFRQDLQKLCMGVIRPALADLRGTLSLIGTPGNVKGFFHAVTTGKVPGWSVHQWSALQNPYMRAQWQEEVDALERDHPGISGTPLFRQMYLGEWTVDETRLVYRYSSERNDVAALPEAARWHYVMGIDLGYEDATAIVVCAWRAHDRSLFVVHAEKRTRQTVSQVADWVDEVRKRYPVGSMVVDGAAKQSVEELRQRYQLPLEAADKAGKVDAIAMLNSDMMIGRIRVVQPACADLATEWRGLVWDDKAEQRGKRQEHPACPNHLADAMLYAWRYAWNYLAKAAPPELTEEQRADAADERDAKRALRKRKGKAIPFWERDAA